MKLLTVAAVLAAATTMQVRARRAADVRREARLRLGRPGFLAPAAGPT